MNESQKAPLASVHNHRSLRALALLDRIVRSRNPFGDITAIHTACRRFSFYSDQQSARIARRCHLPSFCGVPSSFCVDARPLPPARWVSTVSGRGYILPIPR